MHRIRLVLSLLALLAQPSFAQTGNSRFPHQPKLTSQNSGTANDLISVSPVNAKVVWASGRNGTFTKTIDGGKTWRAGVVPGAEALQFRDIQGVSDKIAYLLSIGNGADSRIYKTEDGGKTWTVQFQNQDPNAFYDCFAFWTPTRGLAQSDAVNGRFPVIRTRDGANWEDIGDRLPPAQSGEASFASSGTCVATQGERNAWIVTGGTEKARVLATRDGGYNWHAFETPITQGTPSSGIFSVDFRDERHGMIAGGELDPTLPNLHRTARSRDGGKTWKLTTEPPTIGTIYGLSYANEPELEDDHRAGHDHDFDDRGHDKDFDDDHDDHDDGNRTAVITGPGGSAWTPDEGNTWFTLQGLSGFWGVGFASSHTGWLVGVKGEITRIDF